MPILQASIIPGFDELDISPYLNSFVPYLYLDGHRSSNIGDTDFECYNSGYRFFLRFSRIMQEFGFREMVTMVHTSRNCHLKERLDSILLTIQKSINDQQNIYNNSRYKLYGDIEFYKNIGYNNFYQFLNEINNKTVSDYTFTNHILVNYSEQWAIDNMDKINLLPEVSSVIRFTKGFVSGGWIPAKMQKTVFVYSQIPSVSEYWSDDAIKALIFIALKNWSFVSNYIGVKQYGFEEKNLIHTERDINLKLSTNKLDIENPIHNRIIAFGIDGPIIYEL